MDGFGDPDNITLACELPDGYVIDNTDCDDTNSAVNPDAVEICNDIDDDCDGLIDDEDESLVTPWNYEDVTEVDGAEGEVDYDLCDINNGQVTLDYYSPNLNTSVDNQGYLYTELCGDGELSFKVESVSSYAYVGITFRETNDPGAKKVALFSNKTNILRWETRYTANTPASIQSFYKPFPYWIRLVRQGNWVFGYYSATGTSWSYVHAVNVPMENCIQAGITILSYFPEADVTATVSHVNFSQYNPSLAPGLPIHSVSNDEQVSMHLYPNPVSNDFWLEWSNSEQTPEQIRIFDQTGRMIQQIPVEQDGSNQLRLSADEWQPGMHWLEVILSDGGTKVMPLMKE